MIIVKEHDNTDRDIIIINKDSLNLKLSNAKEFYNSSNSAFGFGGVAIALITSGYLTETFHSVGFIPGETIRSIFIALGIIFLGFTIKSALSWYKLRNTYEPESIVSNLLKNDSIKESTIDNLNLSFKNKVRKERVTIPR